MQIFFLITLGIVTYNDNQISFLNFFDSLNVIVKRLYFIYIKKKTILPLLFLVVATEDDGLGNG